MRSQNVTEKVWKVSLFLQKSLLFRISLSGPGRSLVENDRPLSFHGAPDSWWAVRFLGLFLNYESFPFRELVPPSRR
jgi:hypothetical protein